MLTEQDTKNIIVSKYSSAGLETLIVACELPVGKCRVDVAIFDEEEAWAFEIKTFNDNLKRLERQIEEYKKFFNRVYVVLDYQDTKKYNEIKNKYDDIGIITIDDGYFIREEYHGYNYPDADYIYENLYTWQLRLFDDDFRESYNNRDELRAEIFNCNTEIIDFWRWITRITYKKTSRKLVEFARKGGNNA